MTPSQPSSEFHAQRPELGVHLFLSGVEGNPGELIGARVAGLPLMLNIAPVTDWIDPEHLGDGAAAVVQVDADTPASIKRFERLVVESKVPMIAAAYDPPLTLVRALLRGGAHDVLPLPLSLNDLETSLRPLLEQVAARDVQSHLGTSRLVSVIKARGGAGATVLATQVASRFAAQERLAGRQACFIDLDLQFGDASFQLGLQPRLSVADLIEAGSRLDGEVLRTVSLEHVSGLQVIASPPEMMPLETLGSEQVIAIIDRAMREYGTVFVDLPANWTNWSLSLVARSHLVLLVTDLSVVGLHRARRQLDLLQSQGLGTVDLRVVVNRFEKSMFKGLRGGDATRALGREIGFTLANEPDIIGAAIDRGVPISEVKRKSTLGRDLDALQKAVSEALGLEQSR